MSKESRNEITFDGLQQFLRNIGFNQFAKIDSTLAFHHCESGTIVTLTIPIDGSTVRSADRLSIAMRLENQGLVADSVLHQFRSGNLPMAS